SLGLSSVLHADVQFLGELPAPLTVGQVRADPLALAGGNGTPRRGTQDLLNFRASQRPVRGRHEQLRVRHAHDQSGGDANRAGEGEPAKVQEEPAALLQAQPIRHGSESAWGAGLPRRFRRQGWARVSRHVRIRVVNDERYIYLGILPTTGSAICTVAYENR